MIRTTLIVVSAVAALNAGAAFAAHAPDHAPAAGNAEKVTFRLLADRTAYAPGAPARIAAMITVEPGWHVNSNKPTFDFLIPTTVEFSHPQGWQLEGVEYPEGEMKSFAFTAGKAISVYDGEVRVVARARAPENADGAGPAVFEATLRYQACSDTICLPPITTRTSLSLALGSGGAPANAAAFGAAIMPGVEPVSLVLMLLIALIGGLILNAMPCVLPVLSLKLLALVKTAGEGNAQVVKGALTTSAGILISFWALAAAAAGAKAAGAAVGWGVQFQQPVFVAALTVIVVLFCLNLWGLFEVRLPGLLSDVAATAGPKAGLGSHLAAGFFATLMATPCSAPFLGTAIGFALSQSTPQIFAIFTLLGVGMALPYLVVAAVPRSVKLLPRPGNWMGHFKIFMGFLLAATAVWLLYVLHAQLSAERLAFLELSLLALALFLWARKRAGTPRARLGFAVATLGAAVVTVGIAWGGQGEAGDFEPSKTVKRIDWTPFDRARAEQLALNGTPVFVDVTADWCFTCKVNEALVLETEEISTAFKTFGVVAMRADWTNRDDSITRFLRDHGRYGIPFYLLYKPGGDSHLFGELITKREIISVLESSAGATVTVKRPPAPAGPATPEPDLRATHGDG